MRGMLKSTKILIKKEVNMFDSHRIKLKQKFQKFSSVCERNFTLKILPLIKINIFMKLRVIYRFIIYEARNI